MGLTRKEKRRLEQLSRIAPWDRTEEQKAEMFVLDARSAANCMSGHPMPVISESWSVYIRRVGEYAFGKLAPWVANSNSKI